MKKDNNINNIVFNVTSGKGGDSTLVVGKEKTALFDCGMAYSADKLILNIKRILNDRPLDYVFLTHSHYDHIGGLPYIKNEFKDTQVFASKHCEMVFKRRGAIKLIGELSSEAAKKLDNNFNLNFQTDNIAVDRVLADNEAVSLGNLSVKAIETKGHTDCSMSFYIDELKLLILSESTGVPTQNGLIYTSILKSFDESVKSSKRCMGINAESVIFPHYGITSGEKAKQILKQYIEIATVERNIIKDSILKGLDDKVILNQIEEMFWNEDRSLHQPKKAFEINALHTVNMYRKEFEDR